MLNKLKPIQKNSRINVDQIMRDADNQKKAKVMKSNTLSMKDDDSDDAPDEDWADLPDPSEKKNVILSKKQRFIEQQ